MDDTYIGDNDQWHMPVYCLERVDSILHTDEQGHSYYKHGVQIKHGDKIGQFRVMEVMPEIEFEEVENFGNQDRGGFGTTSKR